MAKFYDISERYKNLMELLENPDIEFELIQDALNSIDDEFNDKADNIARLMRDINYDIDAIKSEEKRLADRRKSLENRYKNLKEYLEANMIAVNKTKFKTVFFSYNIQKNPPSLDVLDENAIPEEYMKVEVVKTIDKKGLLAELKSGKAINGCAIKQSESLRIR